MAKHDIRINCANFWPTYDKSNNVFTDILNKEFNVIIDELNPQVLIYTRYGREEQKYYYNQNVLKIYFTIDPLILKNDGTDGPLQENYKSFNFQAYYDNDALKDHYSVTSDLLNNNKNHYYLPYYIYCSYFLQKQILESHRNVEDWSTKKDISFVYSNSRATHRNEYFDELSKYFKINSGGKHLNNIGYTVSNKIEFLSKHSFDLSIENCFEFGYSTEKIIDPILAKTIPIYWGYVPELINPKRYVKAPPNPHDLIKYLNYLMNNPEVANNIIRQPALIHNDAFKNEFDKFSSYLYDIINNFFEFKKPITKIVL